MEYGLNRSNNFDPSLTMATAKKQQYLAGDLAQNTVGAIQAAPGVTHSLTAAHQLVEATGQLDARLRQVTERLFGGVPQAVDSQNTKERGPGHGGAIGEIESCLMRVADTLRSVEESLVRLERFV